MRPLLTATMKRAPVETGAFFRLGTDLDNSPIHTVLPDNEELLAGKHFVGIGSYKPNMREFPKALFKLLTTVYVDTEYALDESGDLITPLQNDWIKRNQVMTLGRFLAENRSEDQIREETTLFKSVGMALFDVCSSRFIYERANQKGLGQKINV